ncbi:hypothetical protein LTR84_008540 [Exophiala bonariae]|uniref:Glycosyltransferase 2-like domain-containing protein n=1 Tax=Exophiala bonariae TaxID=1690606 RepID=A0AAV9MWK1_9EURO|nr:hypothetical protein LTR84_008540 [Exophiala bonariae]
MDFTPLGARVTAFLLQFKAEWNPRALFNTLMTLSLPLLAYEALMVSDMAFDEMCNSSLAFGASALSTLVFVVCSCPQVTQDFTIPTLVFMALASPTFACVAFSVPTMASYDVKIPTFEYAALVSPVTWGFLLLLIFRYLRLIVHMTSFFCYRASPVVNEPTFTANDVTVIIPTVDPNEDGFLACLQSILLNHPHEVKIVTVGDANLQLAEDKIRHFRTGFPDVKITVSAISNPGNKRKQLASVLPTIQTAITISADASVYWSTNQFIPAVIAPLEDPKVGAVAPHKRVHRLNVGFGWKSFWNFLGCLYLQRHNWELRTSNAVDGGLFVISGRTAVFRTEILQDPEFLYEYLNEKMFFGLISIPNVDDDNFITRWLVTKGWKLKFQQAPNSTMEILALAVYKSQPWSVYSVYITGLTNFALFWDPLMLWTLSKTSFYYKETVVILVVWILTRYYVFAYAHSLIKLYTVLTFWKTSWGGRNLDADKAWLSFLNNPPRIFSRLWIAITGKGTAGCNCTQRHDNDNSPNPSPDNNLSDLERWWARTMELAAEDERKEARKEKRNNFRRRGHGSRKQTTLGKDLVFTEAARPPPPPIPEAPYPDHDITLPTRQYS